MEEGFGGALALATAAWLMALWVPQPAPPAWGDVWWWRNQLILLTGVSAWALMSLIMVLAVRPAWLEKPLDGLDKSYRLHKWAGIGAIVLALLHYGLQLVAQPAGGLGGPSGACAAGGLVAQHLPPLG